MSRSEITARKDLDQQQNHAVLYIIFKKPRFREKKRPTSSHSIPQKNHLNTKKTSSWGQGGGGNPKRGHLAHDLVQDALPSGASASMCVALILPHRNSVLKDKTNEPPQE